MVKLQEEVFVLAAELLVEQHLGCFAIRTGGLAEEEGVVHVDDALCLRLCGEHGGREARVWRLLRSCRGRKYGCGIC
jgi:hypothetical protein